MDTQRHGTDLHGSPCFRIVDAPCVDSKLSNKFVCCRHQLHTAVAAANCQAIVPAKIQAGDVSSANVKNSLLLKGFHQAEHSEGTLSVDTA